MKTPTWMPTKLIVTYLQDDGSAVSVFIFDSNTNGRRNLLPFAKNALRKLRTIRHPDVLKFIEVVETDSSVTIMTERVQPLRPALFGWNATSNKEREEWTIWGLHRVVVCL